MAGFDNDVVYGSNVDFSGNNPVTPQVTLDGQLLIGSAASPNIRVGTLSSSDGSLAITNAPGAIDLSVVGGAPYISLSPYIVGSDVHSGYSTIQDAIDAAVTAGASNSSQANIYVKPGTYVEDITLTDGINIIAWPGMSGIVFQSLGTPQSVIISGTVSFGSPITASMTAIEISPPADSSCINANVAGALSVLYTKGCFFNATGTGKCLSISGAAGGLQHYGDSDIHSSAGAWMFINTGGFYTTNIVRSNIVANSASTNLGIFAALFEYSDLSIISIDSSSVDAEGCSITAYYCTFNMLVPAYKFGVNCLAPQFIFRFCFASLDSAGSIVNAASNGNFVFANCYNIYTDASLITNTGDYILQKSFCLGSGAGNPTGAVSKGVATFQGSDQFTAQGAQHTTDATTTTLASANLNELESIIFKGNVIAAKSDHTDSCGGDFFAIARRASGGNITLVGSVVTNIETTSTATFTVDVDTGTQTIRLRVTGIAATLYNWVTTYSYQKVLNNT